MRNNGVWEQAAFKTLYDANQHGEQKHVLVTHSRHLMNAFSKLNEWRWGDFVWHNSGCPGYVCLVVAFRKFLNKHSAPPVYLGGEDYLFRSRVAKRNSRNITALLRPNLTALSSAVKL